MPDLIDRQALSDLYGGDQDMMDLLITRFVDKFRVEGAKGLTKAVAGGDMEVIRREAHNIKTSALIICASGCADLAHQVELAAIAQDAAEVARTTPQVAEALQALLDSLS